jgi:predicted protein tyrosine phosphatase
VTSPIAGPLAIVNRTGAGEILCSPKRRAGFAYLISIGGVREPPPAGMGNIATRLRLVFEDAASLEEGGSSRSDVQRLLLFAAHVDLARGGLIVQCQAGISRSSAAALIVMATILGPGRELEAARLVLQANPLARPNPLMLRVAGELMGRGEHLAEAWALARAHASGSSS